MRALVVSGLLLCLSWGGFVVAHLYFLEYYLYWHYAWLDILMHVLGGALIVLSAYVCNVAALFPRYSRLWVSHPLFVLSSLAIGWEIFKYAIATELLPNYPVDTLLDLLAGLGGGLLGYLVIFSRKMRT